MDEGCTQPLSSDPMINLNTTVFWGSGRKEYAAMKLTLMLMGGSAFLLSLDIFQIIMGIEEEFDIEIPNEAAEQIVTVGDAVEQIKNALN